MYTHRKHPYYATAIQWDQTNLKAISNLIGDKARSVSAVGQVVFIRYEPGECNIVRPNGWVVKGENGDVKIYDDETFRIKYEPIASALPKRAVTDPRGWSRDE